MIKKGPGFCLVLLVVLLQFGFTLFLDPSSLNGKQLLFATAVLGLFCWVLVHFRHLKIPPIFSWVGCLFVVLLLSALQAFSPYTAFLALGVLAVGLVCMLLAVQCFSERPGLGQTFIDLLLFAGVVGATIGLYQYVDYLTFQNPNHPYVAGLVPPTWSSRVSGIYGQPNMFALFLTLCLLAFSYRYLHTELFFRKLPSVLRFLPVVLIGLVFFATHSRNGLISLAICFAALTIFYLQGQEDRPRLRREFLLFIGSLVVAYLGFWLMANLAGSPDVQLSDSSRIESNDGRLVLWVSSLLMFLDYPWLGVGLDNYKLLLSAYQALAHDLLGFVEYEAIIYSKWSHNDLLQILCEGGGGAFILAASLVVIFLRSVWRLIRQQRSAATPFFFYSHLFLLPFLAQSVFSWPFRFPVIMFLFWTLSGMLLAQYPLRLVKLSPSRKSVFVGLTLLALLVAGQSLIIESKIGEIYRATRKAPLEQNWADFDSLMQNPYSEFRLMQKLLPQYINLAYASDEQCVAERVLPMAERSVEFQGTYTQLYGLALLYEKVGRDEESRLVLNRAIALQPVEGAAWGLLHHLNVVEASEKTGRPIESFYEREDGSGEPLSVELPNAGFEIKEYQ